MDTETLFRVIKMLDQEIWQLIYEHSELQLFMIADDYSATEIKEADALYKAEKKALVNFRDQLQKYVDKQVAQMETEQGM
jgi:hypothetical protein